MITGPDGTVPSPGTSPAEGGWMVGARSDAALRSGLNEP